MKHIGVSALADVATVNQRGYLQVDAKSKPCQWPPTLLVGLELVNHHASDRASTAVTDDAKSSSSSPNLSDGKSNSWFLETAGEKGLTVTTMVLEKKESNAASRNRVQVQVQVGLGPTLSEDHVFAQGRQCRLAHNSTLARKSLNRSKSLHRVGLEQMKNCQKQLTPVENSTLYVPCCSKSALILSTKFHENK
jgi:hypothetical protein